MFFVTHAVVLPSQENLDLIIIDDFEGGSGMGNQNWHATAPSCFLDVFHAKFVIIIIGQDFTLDRYAHAAAECM